MGSRIAIVLAALLAAGLSAAGAAIGGDGEPAASALAAGSTAQQSTPRNRERWERMTPEAQERLRGVYRRLEELPPAARARLLERLKKMSPADRRRAIDLALERLRRAPRAASQGASDATGEGSGVEPPRRGAKDDLGSRPHTRPEGQRLQAAILDREARRRLERLPPSERAREAERLIEAALERWSERLPGELRKRVKLFGRREQLDFLRAYREAELLLKTFPTEAEVRVLLDLPAEDIRALPRPNGPRPDAVSAESWKRWQALGPEQRRGIMRRLERLKLDTAAGPRSESQK